MKAGLTEIVAILDKSGSMAHLTGDTIGGYNNFIREQQALSAAPEATGEGGGKPGEAILSTILFSTGPERVLHNRVDIKSVQPITEQEYSAGGGTALLDALGRAMHHIRMIHKHCPDSERPEKTIVFIITDGEEISSVQYDYARIQARVKRQQEKYGWEFMYLGANVDAFRVASSMGFRQERAFNYTAEMIGQAHLGINKAVRNLRRFKDIDQGEDYRKEIV
jgi:uncharacterized protein YegL